MKGYSILILLVISFQLEAQIERYSLDDYKWVCNGFYYDYFPAHGLPPKPSLVEYQGNLDSLKIQFDTIEYKECNKSLRITGSIYRRECYIGNSSKALILAGHRIDTIGIEVDYLGEVDYRKTKVIGKIKVVNFRNFDYCYSDMIMDCYQKRKFACTLNIEDTYDILVIGMGDAYAVLFDIKSFKKTYSH